MAVQTRIQMRRGTASQWSNAAATIGNGILYQGEVGYETDTGRFKIGDGSTSWSSLSYASVIPSGFIAGSGISVTSGANGSTLTISLSDPTIQVSDITNFVDGVNDRVADLLTAGNNIQLTYVDNGDDTSSLSIAVTGVSISGHTHTASDITDFNSAVSGLLPVKNVSAGSGISVSSNNGDFTVALSDPTIQLADVTDLTSDAKTFLLTPSSANLKSLVSDETGSGSLVFGTNPTLTGVTVSGDITVSGSGLLASNINDFDSRVRTSRLDQMAAPTASVSLNSQKITGLATPTDDTDAATKAYVDAARSGLDVKQSVRVATTSDLGNITIAAPISLPTIDGVVLSVGDRILVKNQNTASQNGIYTIVGTGPYSYIRATDADSSAEVTAGMFTFVAEGTVNADSGWVLTTNDAITLGTTGLAFAQFSGAGQITAGAGMTKSGNTLDVATADSGRIVINSDSIDLATVSQTDGSGSAGTSFIQAVTRDSYGRVTGVTSASVQDGSTSTKGIASFDSGDFSVSSGAVSIKASGVDNSQLANSSVTIGSTSVSLGATATTLSGLTSVSSTGFTGDLTGNASTATALQTARTINGTSFNGTENITISFVDGGTP